MKNTETLQKLMLDVRVFWRKVLRYTVVIFIVVILGLYGLLVYRIGELSQVEPADQAVSEQLGRTKPLKIDQNSVDKIQQLEDQNIGVQSLFKAARDNPFEDN